MGREAALGDRRGNLNLKVCANFARNLKGEASAITATKQSRPAE